MIFMVVIIVFISRMPEMSAYLVPSAAASILIAMLVNVPLAAIVLAILSMFVAVVNGFDFNFFFVSLVGGFTGIYTTWNVRTRKDIMKAGFWISGANMAAILSMFLLQHEAFNKTVMNDMLCGLGNGFLSVVLTIGILPYLEEIFSIATDIKLLELADFNQPLLRKLMIEAPGTYHHSLLVGTLAEKAAETVGADALLTRVGAYYHDIGKLTKPEYFSENQSELPSKHEDLTPNMSSLILISHVKDGVALAKSHRLSKSIVDIIQQHHGTSLILYFYLKALEEYKSSALEEMKYRYMGPKPRTREAGIIMISDAVEAACRTLEEPSYDRIKDTVNKVINNKFSDGQLDECNITLLNLHRIAESFARTMTGIYHTRVEYAESTDKKSTEENQV